MSRVCYHLGCSDDDKAQVQGPVIVGIFLSVYECVCVCVCVCRAKQTEKDLSQTQHHLSGLDFSCLIAPTQGNQVALPPTASVDSVVLLPLTINGEEKGQ